MTTRIYKYIGSSYLDQVLGPTGHSTLKCSYPKAFNDPYELFLTVDFNAHPEVLAYYAEVIGDLPQIPTTCFSRSPVVVPMWAHYAENHRGFVIEFDESKVSEFFPGSGFGDVDYQDAPNGAINGLLLQAWMTKKPRYVYLLHRAVFSAAYYTKATCWAYEQERRMLVRERETRQAGDLILMDVPSECVTALICGSRASIETIQAVSEKATEIGCPYYQVKIGRTSAVPFLVYGDGGSFTFNGSAIEASPHSCGSCGEPLANDAELCTWCQITEAHELRAAMSNPYRMLADLGMLGEYVQGMEEITRRKGEA
jgi:hypothetical protein